ncbi:MAG: phosphocholine cytidylyltransferase family protein [Gammaproteobacteria bacterium]
MEAIILAAGRGKRLIEFNPDGRPKSLLEFGGRSLLDRELEWLDRCGVGRVELVIGYEADRIIEHVGALRRRPEVSFSYNPRFLDGSVVSLLTARDTLLGGDDVLLLDADVLFHPAILQRLAGSGHRNCYLLDREFVPGDEPVKIAVRDGRMVEFRKRLAPDLSWDVLGESVGFFRFGPETARALAEACARYDAEGLVDAPHEEVLRDLLLQDPGSFAYEDVTGLPWLEIDFPEDVERAVKQTLPAIQRDVPDF